MNRELGTVNSFNGFTLIELAVVLLILAIGIGIAVPTMESLSLGNARKANLRRLQGLVNELRNQAQLEGKAKQLVIQLSSIQGSEQGKYWIRTQGQKELTSSEKEAAAKTLLTGSVRLLGVQKGDGPVQSSGEASISFLPQGLVEPASVYVLLDGKTQRIAIPPFSANLRIKEVEASGPFASSKW